MTAVRGSVLGYAVGLTVFAFLWMIYKPSRIGKLAFKTLISAAVYLLFFSSLFNDSSIVKNSKYLSRITNLSLTAVTVQTRFWAWQAGLKGGGKSPNDASWAGDRRILISLFQKLNPKFFVGSGSETLFDRAHNMFVEILVTMGIIGFLAYINIFIALFASLRKLLKNDEFIVYGAGLMSVTIAYIIHNSFIFDTSANLVVFFTIAGFISYLSIPAEDKNSTLGNKSRIFNPALINLTTAFLIILFRC